MNSFWGTVDDEAFDSLLQEVRDLAAKGEEPPEHILLVLESLPGYTSDIQGLIRLLEDIKEEKIKTRMLVMSQLKVPEYLH